MRVRSGGNRISGRRTRRVGSLLAAIAILGTLLAAATPAHASVASDQAQITALEKKIASDGQRVQSLVQKSNDIQAHLDTLNSQIASDQQHLDADIQQQQAQAAAARRVAVLAYVTRGGSDNSMLSLFESATTMTSVLAQSTYLNSVNANIDNTLSALSIDQQRTKADQSNLDSERSQARDARQAHVVEKGRAGRDHVRQLAAEKHQGRLEGVARGGRGACGCTTEVRGRRTRPHHCRRW